MLFYRALVVAVLTGASEDAFYVCRVVYFEQLAGIRKDGPLVPVRLLKQRHDLARVIRAVLVRRDLYVHLKMMFPLMKQYVDMYGSDTYYEVRFGIKSDFTLTDEKKNENQRKPPQDDGDLDADGQEDSSDALVAASCSTYSCQRLLKGLCEKLARGFLEGQLCTIAANSTPGKALDLGDSQIAKMIADISALYAVDFPPTPIANTTGHKVVHETLEVVTHRVVESEGEYRQQLAEFNERALQHENKAALDFVNSRVIVISDDMQPGTTLANKLEKVPLLLERKRKLVIFDASVDAGVNWTDVKKRRRNIFSAPGPGLCVERLKVCVEDVFPVGHSNNAIQAETDVMVVMLRQDTKKRTNVVETARTTLSTLGKKHCQVVGIIELDASETLQRFKRGKKAFGAHVEDKMLASSEKGFDDAVCGKMRYLNADTYFNRWPIPMLPVATMPQMKEELHEKLFDTSAMEARIDDDDGDEDDLGVASELSEGMVIPFPLEKHHVLAQEMLNVFKAEVLLDASPGSGQTMLAVLLANLRGVAIARNSVHQ